MKNIIKFIIATLGGIITLNGIALFFVSNINFGNFLTVILGFVILVIVLAFRKLSKWLKILLITGICIAVAFSSFLIIYGKNDTPTHDEDAIIVLGAAIHGKTPSLALKKRLDKAAKYLKQTAPNAVIIVSGGKGNGEDITEAEAMQKYLVDNHGIPTERIIKEEKATSTYENFVFSKQILDNYFKGDYTSCFITSEYHVLRASLCAKKAGITNISHQHSNTNLSYLVSGSLRECFAVMKYIVFKS